MRSILFLLVVLCLSACSSTNQSSGQVNHVVLCWLKKDASQAHFIKTVQSLKSIPQVQKISVGKKLNSMEPVADNTFDVAFTLTFASAADLNTYLHHGDHQKALNTVFKPALKKVVVYDFLED